MRLGQLPHNPRWALNLFACVAILGASTAAGVHYLQLDKSTTARYVSKRLRAFRAAAAFWIFFVALSKLFVKGFWPLTKYTDQTYLLLARTLRSAPPTAAAAASARARCTSSTSAASARRSRCARSPGASCTPRSCAARTGCPTATSTGGRSISTASRAADPRRRRVQRAARAAGALCRLGLVAHVLHGAGVDAARRHRRVALLVHGPLLAALPRTYAIFVAFYLGNFAAISIRATPRSGDSAGGARCRKTTGDDMLGLSPRSGKESPAMSRRDEEGQEEEEEGGFEFAGESTQHI